MPVYAVSKVSARLTAHARVRRVEGLRRVILRPLALHERRRRRGLGVEVLENGKGLRDCSLRLLGILNRRLVLLLLLLTHLRGLGHGLVDLRDARREVRDLLGERGDLRRELVDLGVERVELLRLLVLL